MLLIIIVMLQLGAVFVSIAWYSELFRWNTSLALAMGSGFIVGIACGYWLAQSQTPR
jgi:uncharacterized protein (DUF486 family)